MKNLINTEKAPQAIGPYSQGRIAAGLLFTSGQIPINPDTGKVDGTTVEEQTKQVFANIKAIVEAAGSSMEKVIKTVCFIKDMNDFAKVNHIYGEFFTEGDYPARSVIEVSRLPKDVLVKIEAVAEVG